MAWRVVFLTMWVPGALSAQVFNYEPYDDSDLLGEFERPKKLHFGMNINVVKPGGASSVFYNGTGFSELGDVFRELISIPERLDWNSVQGGSGNTVRNQIAQSLSKPLLSEGVSKPFQKAPLKPQTCYNAMDQLISLTTLNKD